MNFDEISRQYFIISDPNSGQQERNQALAFTQEFRNKPECLQWILATYPTMENKNVRIQQLLIIKQWCKVQYEPFPQEVYTELRNLLFTQQIHEIFQEKDFKNILADAQVSFMWKVFPLQWPTFWEDFFNSFNNDYRIDFLYAFTKYASILDGKDNYLFSKIKDEMRANNSDNSITSYTIGLMSEGNPIAFEIFAFLCKWVYTIYLLPAQGIIKEGLKYPNFSNICLNILSQLVSRGMQNDLKFELIATFEIPNQINLLLPNCNNDVVATAAASLVNSAGEVMISTPDVDAYVNLAMFFLMHVNNDVSLLVFPFLVHLCKEKPEISTIILFKAIERITIFIENDLDETGYLDQISVVTRATINAAPEKNLMEVLSYWGGEENGAALLANKPSLAVSIIYVVSEALSPGEPKQFIPEFILRFLNILNAPPPISPLMSFGIVRFLKFFIAVYENFNPEQISYVFRFLCNFSLLIDPRNYENFHANITQVLNQFLKKLDPVFIRKDVQFDPQIIIQFIMTQDPPLVSAAGFLIRSLDANIQPQVFEQCMGQLQQSLGQIEPDQQILFIPTILSFVKSLKYQKDAPHIPSVTQFLQNTVDICSSNDELFSLYIRTAFSSLGDMSFPIIYNCRDKITIGFNSCSSFCDAIIALLKSDLPKDNWVTEFVNYLYSIIIPLFNNIKSWEIENGRSEQNNEILNVTCRFIQLFSIAISIAMQLIDPQVYISLKSFIIQAMNEHFDIPSLMDTFMDLFKQIAKLQIDDSIYDELGRTAMSFLYTTTFNANIKQWFNVVKKLMSFHIELMTNNPERGSILITNSFRIFVPNEQQLNEFVAQYLGILQLPRPRDQSAQGRIFFTNFAKFLAQNH